MTKKYMGFKMVDAWKQDKEDENGYLIPGYAVKYADGYISWSPRDLFEKSYMEIGDNNTIRQEDVKKFVKEYEVTKLGEKTTIVKATLANGFTIVESSSCVDPANFSEEIGSEICIERIENKIWELLGFLLQTASNGIK